MLRIPRRGELSVNTYIAFVRWNQQSVFNPMREVEYGRIIKVKASDISEAWAKIKDWLWLSAPQPGVIEKVEILDEIETI